MDWRVFLSLANLTAAVTRYLDDWVGPVLRGADPSPDTQNIKTCYIHVLGNFSQFDENSVSCTLA